MAIANAESELEALNDIEDGEGEDDEKINVHEDFVEPVATGDSAPPGPVHPSELDDLLLQALEEELGLAVPAAVPIIGESPPAGAAPGSEPDAVAEPLSAMSLVGPDLMWGVFKITFKVATGPHGGYQVACPSHRKNTTTACKRTFRVEGPSAESKEVCFKRMLRWATVSKKFLRQRHHMSLLLPSHESGLPSAAWPQRDCITSKPAIVDHDDYLDLEYGSPVAPPVPTAEPVMDDVAPSIALVPLPAAPIVDGGRGRGRGRGGCAHGGRGRG